MARDIVAELFKRADELQEQREEWNAANNGVRDSLRSLRAAGVLTDKQAEQVEEIYPTRTRTRGGDVDDNGGQE